mgnify:CR=1 FL=1
MSGGGGAPSARLHQLDASLVRSLVEGVRGARPRDESIGGGGARREGSLGEGEGASSSLVEGVDGGPSRSEAAGAAESRDASVGGERSRADGAVAGQSQGVDEGSVGMRDEGAVAGSRGEGAGGVGSRGGSASGVDVEDEEVERCFGIAAWGTLAEPGDAVAGAVTQALGAGRSLALLIERQPAERWHAELPVELTAELALGDLASGIERWAPRLSSSTVVSALRASARLGATLVMPGDPWWPPGLLDLGVHAPLALWVRGDPEHLVSEAGSIAVVGSRDATSYGEHVAAEIASGLVDRGVTVTSGAAYGIDGMAHRAVLAAGGHTIAFLAGGVDRLYPAAHHDLLLRIAETGALVSELPCGSSPTKWRFLQRNRLIAASTQATVVVEAGFRSGSLNTAGHAAALGRPIGAVPGPVTSATSAGCHRLLREYDATCVTSADEVAELIGHATRRSTGGLAAGGDTGRDDRRGGGDTGRHDRRGGVHPAPHDRRGGGGTGGVHGPDGTRLLDALSRRKPRGVTELARLTGLAPRSITAALGVLLLEGVARETESGWLRM